MDHDEAVRQAIEIVEATDESAVVAAWVGSLSSRDLAARAAFGSYVVLRHLPEHAHTPRRTGGPLCGVCSLRDTDVSLWTETKLAERNYQFYPAVVDFALSILANFPHRTGKPAAEDDDRLWRLLGAIRALPPTALLADLDRAVQQTVPSNKRERTWLLETLGYAGILCPADQTSYADEFVPADDADSRYPERKSDWAYPIRFWTGTDGVNEAMVTRYFGS